jgi:hypothetical protein
MRVKVIIYFFLMLTNVFCLIKADNMLFHASNPITADKSEYQEIPSQGLLCHNHNHIPPNFNHIPKY